MSNKKVPVLFEFMFMHQANGRFGTATTVVDINQDTYADLVVSAPLVGALQLQYEVKFCLQGSVVQLVPPLNPEIYSYIFWQRPSFYFFQGKVYIYLGGQRGLSMEPNITISCTASSFVFV